MGSRTAAAALTLAVLASACGPGESTDVGSAPASTPSTAPATTAAPATASAETTAPVAAGPTTPIESMFPELVVADVASGSQVSLREVAGTGTPVAMWFWFPH